MSNEIHIGIIEERKKTYPDRSDRPPDVAKWLKHMDHLHKTLPTGVDSIALNIAVVYPGLLHACPEIINAARQNQLAYRILTDILNVLRANSKQDDRTILNKLPDSMITWILDVATGQCEEPKSIGRNKITNLLRDHLIAFSVDVIHDYMKLPYESDEHYSACHEVADYLDIKYGKVRTIWRKQRNDLRAVQYMTSGRKHVS